MKNVVRIIKKMAEMIWWCILLISVLDPGLRGRHLWAWVWLLGAVVEYTRVSRVRRRIRVETSALDTQKMRLAMLVIYPLGSIMWPIVIPIMSFVSFRNILSVQKAAGVKTTYFLDGEPVTEERIEREGL